MELSRRGLLTGLIAAGVCAPAIVRAELIMPVKKIVVPHFIDVEPFFRFRKVCDRLMMGPAHHEFFMPPAPSCYIAMTDETWAQVEAGTHPRYLPRYESPTAE